MSNRLIHRATSLCLAALFTLAMLGGIDSLSQHPEAAVLQWAQQSSIQA